MAPVRPGRDAGELGVRVVHVKHFIAQDFFEHRARGGIVVHDVAIDREPARRGFLGHVQEREQTMVGLSIDAQVVESVTAGKRVRVEPRRDTRRSRVKEGGAALAEQIGVVQFVDRVREIEPAQQGIGSDFSSSEDVAATVALDFSEGDQFPYTPIEIAPDPPMDRPQNPVDVGLSWRSHRERHLNISSGRLNLSVSAMREERRHERVPRVMAETAVALVGVALVFCAVAAHQPWLDRHFLPSFFLPRRWYVFLETGVRVAIAVLGVSLALFVRPRAGRLTARAPALVVSVGVAALLAFGASELTLRRVHLRPAEWLFPEEEPRRRPHARLGWTLEPSRTGHNRIAGRAIEYAIDRAGYRVRRVDEPVDPDRPTLLFIGESMMFGEGLTWDESVPAQVGAIMGLQSANLAVHGYGSDQAYLRLQIELPRFRRPAAVVSLFMTALFGRNLDDDRPHLGPGLVWRPAEQHSRLASIAKLAVPYRSDETVERGITVTRDVLRATVDLARARGATPLIVVPQFGAEAPVERTLRRRILDETGLPYVLVAIDSGWRLPWDRHPNASAAGLIADAVADRIRGQ